MPLRLIFKCSPTGSTCLEVCRAGQGCTFHHNQIYAALQTIDQTKHSLRCICATLRLSLFNSRDGYLTWYNTSFFLTATQNLINNWNATKVRMSPSPQNHGKNYIFLHSLSLITVEFLLTHICIWRRHCRCILMKWERIMMLVSVTDPAGVLLLFLKMLGHVCLIHLFDSTDVIIAQCFITSVLK